MAVELFQKKKLQPALDSVVQALQLAPKNVKLLFSIFKILIVIKKQDEADDSHNELADKIMGLLEDFNLDERRLDAYKSLKAKWDADSDKTVH